MHIFSGIRLNNRNKRIMVEMFFFFPFFSHPNQSLDTLISLTILNSLSAVCGLSLNLGSSETRKILKQKFIFQIGTLNLHGIHEALFIQLLLFEFSRHHIPTNDVAPFSAYKHTHNSLGCHITLPPGVVSLGCKAYLKHYTKYAKHYKSEIFLTIKILVTSCTLENDINKHKLYRSISLSLW